MCISELRGLQDFQTRHPETVVVAMNVLESDTASISIGGLVKTRGLESLRIATGKRWQEKFGVPDHTPVTLIVSGGKVRVMHESAMPDPEPLLEADLRAISGDGAAVTTAGRREVP